MPFCEQASGKPAGVRSEGMDSMLFWTKALSQEFWSGAVTPLMFSIAGGLIEERMVRKGLRVAGLKGLANERFLRVLGGQVYLNSRILEGVVKRIPSAFLTSELLRFLPETIRGDLARIRVSLFSLKTLRILLRLFTYDRDWFPLSNHRAFDRAVARIERARRVRFALKEEALSDSQLLDRSRMLYEEMGDFLDVVTWGILFAYVARPLTEFLARKWGQDRRGEQAALLRVGLDGIRTFEIGREIEGLANEVARDPFLNRLFDPADPEAILDALRGETKAADFLKRFEAFQEAYGHRFQGRDICHATWRERPQTVIKMIQMNRGNDLCRTTFALQKDMRARAERELKARIRRSAFGTLKGTLFSLVLACDRRYFVIRENMRYHADSYLEQFRRLYLEIGRRWQSRGMLEVPEDIVFFRREEIEEVWEKRADILQTAEERKREYKRSCRLRTPEVIPDGADLSALFPLPEEGRTVLNGEVASPGRVTGPARIIRELEDLLDFRKGDILVAQSADPSWSPLVSQAAGLVLEVGGLLSHGSIMAREYRIPALIQAEGAMVRLRTGDRVELDTESKCVRVVPGSPSP